MVQFSFRPPNADYLGFPATPEGILQSACKAEELGFDAVLVNDHIIVDGTPQVLSSWGNTYDPLITLSYVAARTSRILLGLSVLIMPYRNPIATAKMIATLDQLSGGRVIAGVGAGWNEAEFDALGVPFHQRGARTTEYLRLWQACWAPGGNNLSRRIFLFRQHAHQPQASTEAPSSHLDWGLRTSIPAASGRFCAGVATDLNAAAGPDQKPDLSAPGLCQDRP